MAGTSEGAKRGAATFLQRYGPDYRKKNSSKGGKLGGGKGGFKDPDLAARAGAIGGKRSKRNYDKKGDS